MTEGDAAGGGVISSDAELPAIGNGLGVDCSGGTLTVGAELPPGVAVGKEAGCGVG